MNNEEDEFKLMESHLRSAKTIAVVGFSNNKLKTAHTVPKYLTRFYDVIPINPNHKKVAGLQSYPCVVDLNETEIQADIVNIFRPSKDVLQIVENIMEMKHKPKLIFVQLGIRNEKAKKLAENNNIDYVEDTCIYVVHQKLKF